MHCYTGVGSPLDCQQEEFLALWLAAEGHVGGCHGRVDTGWV